jgi:hypothetical protein
MHLVLLIVVRWLCEDAEMGFSSWLYEEKLKCHVRFDNRWKRNSDVYRWN